jgi:hypothetical protein
MRRNERMSMVNVAELEELEIEGRSAWTSRQRRPEIERGFVRAWRIGIES